MRYVFLVCVFFLSGCQSSPPPVDSLVKVQNEFNDCALSKSKSEHCLLVENKITLVRKIAQSLKNNPLEFGQEIISLQTKIDNFKKQEMSPKDLAALKKLNNELEVHMALVALFEAPQ